ncbi:hypothetical protein WDW86_19470 [Bdellovibrionota bacterium FG-2]
MRVFLLGLIFLASSVSSAEEPIQGEPQGVSAESAPAPESPTEKPTKNKKKGTKTGDKETEGTQARNRFEADTVIRSKYQLNGEQLEVDPD